MQSHYNQYQSVEAPEAVLHLACSLPEEQEPVASTASRFHGQFSDCMELHAPGEIVAEHFSAHQNWFCRCAKPMKAEPLGINGYALAIGRFGALGYEVEPKIGLELLPAENNVYRIETIAIPNYTPPGYDVDFCAAMELVEAVTDSSEGSIQAITKVEWHLDLTVYIHFPKFIGRLPKSLIHTTGDRLLNQIVRQVSRRLTAKVQEDFYQSAGIPSPLKSKKGLGIRG